ncbi:MAG: restriction endonuclease subunit S [Saprospiraceae bacterium]|nr:restriction endonuclease subunit S [Saprospiraceae bacterium]
MMDLKNMDKSGWKKYRFEQIASNISERVEPGATNLDIYVGLEHLDSDTIHIKRWGKPADVEGTKLKVYPGDLIFGKRRAYQRKAAIATFEGICSAHAMVLRANPAVIDPQLFPFFIHSDAFMHRAVDISVGSLSPTINWSTLRTQEFLLPPKDQQARLAELLWAGDAVVEGYGRLLEKLAGFSDQKLADYYRALPDLFECRKMKIGDFLKLKNGSAFNPDDWKPIGIPILRIQNLNGSSEFNYFQGDLKSKVLIEKGDLLFAWSGNRGTSFGPFIWPGTRGVLNQHIFKIEFSKAEFDKLFIFYYLKFLTKEIESKAHGSAQLVHITKGEMEKFSLNIPSFENQNQVAKKFSNLHQNKNEIESYILKTKLVQERLLNEIFTP